MQYGSSQPSRANLNSSLVLVEGARNPPSALGANKSLDRIAFSPEETRNHQPGLMINSAQSRREEAALGHPQYYSTHIIDGQPYHP